MSCLWEERKRKPCSSAVVVHVCHLLFTFRQQVHNGWTFSGLPIICASLHLDCHLSIRQETQCSFQGGSRISYAKKAEGRGWTEEDFELAQILYSSLRQGELEIFWLGVTFAQFTAIYKYSLTPLLYCGICTPPFLLLLKSLTLLEASGS